MKRLIPVGVALVVLSTVPSPAGSKGPEGEGNQSTKVSLRLKTSATKGYAPLTVSLDGELVGADTEDLNTCLLSEEWIGETNIGQAPNTKHTIPCVTSMEDGKVPRKFQRDVTLKEPGTYIYKILFTPRGHRTMASRSIEIRAFPSQFEVKSTANGS
ncbi:MAG TPA: hypothetical protein VFU03_08825 [Gemmatimonadales bacterium]|nr:hypothetical protein [Gemmatimonadales bacterium]